MLLIPTTGSQHGGLLPTPHSKKEHRDITGDRTDDRIEMKNVGLNLGRCRNALKRIYLS